MAYVRLRSPKTRRTRRHPGPFCGLAAWSRSRPYQQRTAPSSLGTCGGPPSTEQPHSDDKPGEPRSRRTLRHVHVPALEHAHSVVFRGAAHGQAAHGAGRSDAAPVEPATALAGGADGACLECAPYRPGTPEPTCLRRAYPLRRPSASTSRTCWASLMACSPTS